MKMTNKEYKMKRELQTNFADVVMELIGNEIDRLDAFVYADKYMEYFGVNDSKCFIKYYNKALERVMRSKNGIYYIKHKTQKTGNGGLTSPPSPNHRTTTPPTPTRGMSFFKVSSDTIPQKV